MKTRSRTRAQKSQRNSQRNSQRKSQRNSQRSTKQMEKMQEMVNNMANAGPVKAKRISKDVLKAYRKSLSKSECRKKGPAVCRSKANCKVASGSKRSFCRKSKNRKY